MNRGWLLLARRRVRTEFSGAIPELFLKGLFILAGLFNALAVILALSVLPVEAIPLFQHAMYLSLFVLAIAKDFAPTYRDLVVFDVGYLPIGPWRRLLVNMIGGELNLFNGVVLASLGLMCLSPVFGLTAWLSATSSWLGGLLASYCLRFGLAHTFRGREAWMAICGTGILVFLAWHITRIVGRSTAFEAIAYPASFFFFLALAYRGATIRHKERRRQASSGLARRLGLSFTAKVQGRLIRSLLAGVVYKMILLSLTWIQLRWKEGYLFDSPLLFLLIVSPLCYFTYGLHNFHAYQPALWLNHALRGDGRASLQGHYLRFSLSLLAVDFAITFLVLATTPFEPLGELALRYGVAACALLALGNWCSLTLPVRIGGKSIMSNLKMQVHPLGAALSFVALFASHALEDRSLWPALGFSLVLSVLAILMLRRRFSWAWRRFYQRILA